jgi:hypothetical protein
MQVIKTSMQVTPIDKVEHSSKSQNTAFQGILKKSSHKHYDLLGFREATNLVYKKEGIKGFYRGFNASVVKNTLNAGTYFASLHYLCSIMHPENEKSTERRTHVNALASSMARVI